MVYIAPTATSKRTAGARSGRTPHKGAAEKGKPGSDRALLPSVQKRLTSSQLAEAQAADAKRILDRERQALRLAKQTAPDHATTPSNGDAPLQASQQPQAVLHDFKPDSGPPSGSNIQRPRQLSPARVQQDQGLPRQTQQNEPSSSSPQTAQSQPDHLGSYGLPSRAATDRPAHSFDDATDLASSPPQDRGMCTAAQGQHSPSQPQFMSGLMALHGMTTPEEKRKREEKQKQYARELDEQVSQKHAARSAELAKYSISRHAGPPRPQTGSLQQQQWRQQQQQQQQQQQCPQPSSKQAPIQRAMEDEEHWKPQQAQHVRQDGLLHERSSNSLQRDMSGEDVGMGGVDRGFRPTGGAGVAAAMTSDNSAAYITSSSPPQEGRRGFMAGVAQLKAGPTQEQQHHARVLRERLLADLHQQTEERQRADSKRKAAEAAAEAKQEADIAAYHAHLRSKEANRHSQPSLGREDRPAATGAVRVSPPESLTSSWNGPSLTSQQGPSVVPHDPAHPDPSPDQATPGLMQQGRALPKPTQQGRPVPGPVQHGRRHGKETDVSQESVEPDAEASQGATRPESAAYKAKVGGVLAELQAEQARLRQLCSQQAAAMQDLQRQAQQAAKQHGMPAEHFRGDVSYKVRRSDADSRQHQGIPARHWDSAPEEEEQGDSLDAFVVETRLVPVSLSQIPDRLPDKDLLDSNMDDALTHHQTHHFGPHSQHRQEASGRRQQQAGRQTKPTAGQSETKKDVGRRQASPKRPLPGRPKIWMR